MNQQYVPNRSQRDWHIWIDDCWWLSVLDPKKDHQPKQTIRLLQSSAFWHKLNQGQNYSYNEDISCRSQLSGLICSTRVLESHHISPHHEVHEVQKSLLRTKYIKIPSSLPWGPGFYLTKPGKREPQALKIPPIVPPSWRPQKRWCEIRCQYCKRLVS